MRDMSHCGDRKVEAWWWGYVGGLVCAGWTRGESPMHVFVIEGRERGWSFVHFWVTHLSGKRVAILFCREREK